MTSRERLEKAWACEAPDRVPFVPAVYEQKAFLIGDTPSRVSRDAELFYRSMMTEHETYEADALVVGMDVYNLEAEALGSTVTYYEGDDTSIPGIGAGNHALKFGDDLSQIKVPNPLADGRMPINLEVSRRIARLNPSVPVRGAVSGPFSLALSLLGPEDFFMGTLDDPDYCRRVLEFCAEIIMAFGKDYWRWASWGLIAPSSFARVYERWRPRRPSKSRPTQEVSDVTADWRIARGLVTRAVRRAHRGPGLQQPQRGPAGSHP